MSKDDEALKIRMREVRALLGDFNLKLGGFDPGVTAVDASGHALSFDRYEWAWLEPLLIELRKRRDAQSTRPQGRFRCRVCGEVYDGSQVNPNPQAAGRWTCGDRFCGGVVDKVSEQGERMAIQFNGNPEAESMADLVTPKQLVAIRAISNSRNINAESECLKQLRCRPEELSRRAASTFIDYLKESQATA